VNGPTVYLPGDVRRNSRAFGIPVVTEDGFQHAPECFWCDGAGTSDTCPRSIFLAEYAKTLN
jgi:hypothetical protein